MEREVSMVCVMPKGVWNWLQFDNVASAVWATVQFSTQEVLYQFRFYQVLKMLWRYSQYAFLKHFKILGGFLIVMFTRIRFNQNKDENYRTFCCSSLCFSVVHNLFYYFCFCIHLYKWNVSLHIPPWFCPFSVDMLFEQGQYFLLFLTEH